MEPPDQGSREGFATAHHAAQARATDGFGFLKEHAQHRRHEVDGRDLFALD
jgi:hypothetical protein